MIVVDNVHAPELDLYNKYLNNLAVYGICKLHYKKLSICISFFVDELSMQSYIHLSESLTEVLLVKVVNNGKIFLFLFLFSVQN
jgi:hypothetical protein